MFAPLVDPMAAGVTLHHLDENERKDRSAPVIDPGGPIITQRYPGGPIITQRYLGGPIITQRYLGGPIITQRDL
eukprot:2530025-Pyramimonas_sp.AAC.3